MSLPRDAKRGFAVIGALAGAVTLGSVAKFAGLLDVSWLVVTSPLWGPFMAAFLLRWVTAVVYRQWWELEKRKAGWQ